MIVVNSSTRQFNIPGADMTFGVEADSGSERKVFQCPRYVGNGLDVAGSFVRINYRNANGDIDSYLVNDVTVDGDNITFSWELTPKVTAYKGQVRFVLCVTGPDTKVAWHTTLGTGVVLEGLEPDYVAIQADTADVVAKLIALVDRQTAAVTAEGTTQVAVVKAAAKAAETATVAEIEARGKNVRESIPDDYTALSEAVDGLVRGRAPGILCSAEGTAIAVADASNMAVQGMRIFGRSVQDGVPSPDAPVEIKSVEAPVVTVCGKNLINIHRTDIGKTNSTIMVEGESITVTSLTDDSYARATVPVKYPVDTPLTISFDATMLRGYDFMSSTAMNVYLRKGNTNRGHVNLIATSDKRTYIATIPDGIPEAGYSLWLYIKTTANYAGTVEIKFENIQIEVGSEATAYEPYKAPQNLEIAHTLPGIPVTSGGNYTDSNGQQWICDEVDLERGVYVQRVKRVVLNGTESWQKNTEGDSDNYLYFLRVNDVGGDSSLCDSLQKKASNTLSRGGASADHMGVYVSKTYQVIYMNLCMLLSENTVVGMKNALGQKNVTIHYPLAKTIETPLTEAEIAAYRAIHTHKPNTTVLNDAGAHMAVEYVADTKLYIDNKIKEVLR